MKPFFISNILICQNKTCRAKTIQSHLKGKTMDNNSTTKVKKMQLYLTKKGLIEKQIKQTKIHVVYRVKLLKKISN